MDTPSPEHARMRAVWRQELFKLGLLCGFGALVGALFGSAWWGFVAVLALHVGLHYRYLAMMLIWLRSPKRYELPSLGGLWGEVFDRLIDLQRRNSKRKKRLAAMVAEFQASTEALPDGAVVLTERGEIVRFNLAAQTLLGLRTADVGLRITTLVRYPAFAAYLQAGRYERELELPAPVNPGKTLTARLIPYGQGQRLLIVRDVSELKRLDSARRDFVSNASHELRTPLTVLKGYLEMMVGEAGEGRPLGDWRQPLLEMQRQAQRMETLVQDMLKLARLESEAATRHDWLRLAPLIERALVEAQSLSAGRHRFEVALDASLELQGGETELLSVFGNLITNAVRYTPSPGLIRVSLMLESAGVAVFAVQDSGIGISEADLPRLTERFYRVDVGRSRDSGGTGLGLSIVKHGLERHDARLRIDSTPGKGSTFRCEFPAHRLRRNPAVAAQPAAGPRLTG